MEWIKWKQTFQSWIDVNDFVDADKKKAYLLYYGGEQLREVHDSLPNVPTTSSGPLAGAYCDVYQATVNVLDKYFAPKKNATFERMLFQNMQQDSEERFEKFYVRLCQQAKLCEFGDQMESNIRDQLIQKCLSAELQQKLWLETDISMEKVLTMGTAFEAMKEQLRVVQRNAKKEPLATVNKIDQAALCGRCGSDKHNNKDPKCPAMGKKCFKCGSMGHFGRKCRSNGAMRGNSNRGSWQTRDRPYKRQEYSRHQRENVDVKGEDAKEKNMSTSTSVQAIEIESTAEKGSYMFAMEGQGNEIECVVGNVKIGMIVDSGSKFNVIDKESWTMMKLKGVEVINMQQRSDQIFKAFGGHTLEVIGTFEAGIKCIGKRSQAKFFVMNQVGKPLLGLDTAVQMGVLNICTDNTVANVETVKPLNKIAGVIVKLPIDETVTPVAQQYRRIPIALEEAVNNKIDELLTMKVIEPVSGHSSWISPMVVVPKGDGQVRICLDMRQANLAIKRENYPLPVIDDFLPHMAGSKVFSKLDICNAFHQVEIAPESREITTFITSRGLFRFTRLMFGIKCAPEIFQKILSSLLAGCEGCFNYADDVIIFGRTQLEHENRLSQVMKVLNTNNVKLNEKKCVFNANVLVFLGHEISEKGIRPTYDKVEAVKSFRSPTNKDEVYSFLGLVNFVGRYIPHLASLTYELRLLTKNDTKFVWSEIQQLAFDRLKEELSRDTVLGFFDRNERTILIVDAGPVGLGAVLYQEGKRGLRIIEYAHRSLTEVEQRYCQTEKEALGCVWGTERFHFYLFGIEFDLMTDAQVLLVLFGPKSKPCARIERWVLRIQTYKYRIVFCPGKKNIADPLSRLSQSVAEIKPFDEEAEHYVCRIVAEAKPVAIKLAEIEQCSMEDGEIQAVKKALYENVWTERAESFKLFEIELCFVGNILLRGNLMVMPEVLRQRTLELAHEGHPGIVAMKQRLRSKVWWPKLYREAENWVRKCRSCLLVSAPNPPEPLRRRELPAARWQHVAVDFMGPMNGNHYLLVVVDYYSRFKEVEVMTCIDSQKTIKKLKAIFARNGYPKSMTADNGSQLVSDDFKDFCTTSGIELVTTTPYWPQQNGEVERQNRSLVKRLKISHLNDSDWQDDLQDYLMMYRTTPHSTTGKTPGELNFGSKIRDKIPCMEEPIEIDLEVADKDRLAKHKGKVYADERRRAKPSDITVDDQVVVKKVVRNSKLSPTFGPEVFTVTKRTGAELVVKCNESGKEYRRNVSHVKRVSEADTGTTESDSETPEVIDTREKRVVVKPKRFGYDSD